MSAVRRWSRKRWELRATPSQDTELAQGLADAWNERPERFASTKQAESRAHFYRTTLMLPLQFWVIDTKDRGDD